MSSKNSSDSRNDDLRISLDERLGLHTCEWASTRWPRATSAVLASGMSNCFMATSIATMLSNIFCLMYGILAFFSLKQ